MRVDSSIWGIILERIYEERIKTMEKIYKSLSLEPPYSASVTTLLSCYAKVGYDKKFGGYRVLPTNFNMLLGILFDYIAKLLIGSKPGEEHHFTKEFRDSEGVVYKIHAGPDAVLKDEIIEFKYTSLPLEKLPLEHHEYQLRIYMNIIGLKGRLVYLTPNGVREFLYEKGEALSDEEVANIARSFHVENRSPRYEWECQYCMYKPICPYYVKKEEKLNS